MIVPEYFVNQCMYVCVSIAAMCVQVSARPAIQVQCPYWKHCNQLGITDLTENSGNHYCPVKIASLRDIVIFFINEGHLREISFLLSVIRERT